MSKRYVEQWHVHSFSSDEVYKVSLDDKDIYSCSCNGWIFQRNYPKPTAKRPNPVMRALHDGVLRDKDDLDALALNPNGHCKHIMWVLGNQNNISTAVRLGGYSRIGSQEFFVEVRDGRVLALLDQLR